MWHVGAANRIHYRDRIDPRRLVFIDETWIKTNMAPLRGWGTRGKRVDTPMCRMDIGRL